MLKTGAGGSNKNFLPFSFIFIYMEYKSISIKETRELARNFVLTLNQNDNEATVVAMEGELGSGKTAFTQELGKTLGITEHMQSPTFVIEKIYELVGSKWTHLVHIDAYRLKNEEELLALGFKKQLEDKHNLIVIEWASRVENILHKSAIHIVFTHDGEDQRTIEIKGQR